MLYSLLLYSALTYSALLPRHAVGNLGRRITTVNSRRIFYSFSYCSQGVWGGYELALVQCFAIRFLTNPKTIMQS